MINMNPATTWEPDNDTIEMWEDEWPKDGMWTPSHCSGCKGMLWAESVHVSPNGLIMLCNDCMESV